VLMFGQIWHNVVWKVELKTVIEGRTRFYPSKSAAWLEVACPLYRASIVRALLGDDARDLC
jgi:hypothetical protein